MAYTQSPFPHWAFLWALGRLPTSAINVAQPIFGHNSFPGLHHLPLSFLSHIFWGVFLGQCKHFASEMSLILQLVHPTLPARAPLIVFIFCYFFCKIYFFFDTLPITKLLQLLQVGTPTFSSMTFSLFFPFPICLTGCPSSLKKALMSLFLPSFLGV